MENDLETLEQRQSMGLQIKVNPKGGRPRLKHGGYAYLTRGKVTDKNQRHIQLYLDAARQGLIDDLSGGQGEAALPAAKIILIDRALAVLGILRLIEEHVATQGIIGVNGELSPPLGSSYIQYHNTLRQTLSLLGVDRRKGVNEETLARYLNRKYTKVHDAAPVKQTAATTIEPPAAASRRVAAARPMVPSASEASPVEIVAPGAAGKGIQA